MRNSNKKPNKNPIKSIYHISQWPVWMLIAILRILIYLPYRWHFVIGKYLGLTAQYFARREKEIARVNIARCFSGLSLSEKENLLRESFISMGVGAIEAAFGWWGDKKRLEKLAFITGIENIKQALKKNKGVLAFTPHFSSVHMAGQLANFLHSFGVMFLPPKNPVFRYLGTKSIYRVYNPAIDRHDVRGLIKALKNNRAIFYTPDTDAGRKGIFVPFFGTLTSTVTTIGRLAKHTGCAVVPVTCFRKKDNTGYEIQFYPALENYPSGDAYQDALVINQRLEKFIIAHPEQYIWQYKRFKTRPLGEVDFYSKKIKKF